MENTNIDYAKRLIRVEENHSYDDSIPQDIGFLRYVLNSDSKLLENEYIYSNFCTDEVMSDPELVKILINKFASNAPLQQASEEIKNNREIVSLSIKSWTYALKFASEELKNDKEMVLLAVSQKTNAYGLEFIGTELKKDIQFYDKVSRIAVSNDIRAMQFASDNIKKDKALCLKVIKKNGMALAYMLPEFNDNKDNVLIAVQLNGDSLQFASDRLRNDPEVVLEAIKKEGEYLKHASVELRNNKELVILALNNSKQYGNRILNSLSDNMKDDKDIIVAAMSGEPSCFSYGSDRLKNDKEFVLAAITMNNSNCRYIGEELKEEIGNNDPFKYLQSYLMHEKIQNTISSKENINSNNKMKI